MRRIQIFTTHSLVGFGVEDSEVYKWINTIEQKEEFTVVIKKEEAKQTVLDIKRSEIISYTITMGETNGQP